MGALSRFSDSSPINRATRTTTSSSDKSASARMEEDGTAVRNQAMSEPLGSTSSDKENPPRGESQATLGEVFCKSGKEMSPGLLKAFYTICLKCFIPKNRDYSQYRINDAKDRKSALETQLAFLQKDLKSTTPSDDPNSDYQTKSKKIEEVMLSLNKIFKELRTLKDQRDGRISLSSKIESRQLSQHQAKPLAPSDEQLVKPSFFQTVQNISTSFVSSPTVPVAKGDEKRTSISLKGRGDGEHLQQTFIDPKGVKIGKEEVNRLSTVDERIDSLQHKMKALQTRLDKCKDNPFRKEQGLALEQEIKACKQDLENCMRSDSWVGSNASRELKPSGEGFMTDRNQMLPISVNTREQVVTPMNADGTEGKSVSFLRYGAIWDPRNGLLNLSKLKELDTDFKDCQKDHANDSKLELKVSDEARRLEAMKANYSSPEQIALIDEAIGKVQAFSPSSSATNTERAQIIDSRARFLREQALEPIKHQLKNNQARLMTDQTTNQAVFPMMHLGLLNQNAADDFHETGWAHFESNQIQDTAAIFEELHDYQIVVRDEPGSYFDHAADGKPVLYVSRSEIGWEASMPTEIKLETCFMNVSVQGYTKNDGAQKEINKQNIQRLADWAIRKDDQPALRKIILIVDRLEKGESSFKLAQEIAIVGKDLAALSEGCLSCKDRGGVVAEMIAVQVVEDHAVKNGVPSSDAKAASKKLYAEILDRDGMTAAVTKDNTGVEIVKVDFRELEFLGGWDVAKKCAELVYASFTGGLEATEAPAVNAGRVRGKVDAFEVMNQVFPKSTAEEKAQIAYRLSEFAKDCGINENFMLGAIQRGQVLAQKIANGEKADKYSSKDMVDVEWFLRAQQAKMGALYLKGTMKFPDPDNSFARFVMHTKGTFHGEEVAHYGRRTSHWQERHQDVKSKPLELSDGEYVSFDKNMTNSLLARGVKTEQILNVDQVAVGIDFSAGTNQESLHLSGDNSQTMMFMFLSERDLHQENQSVQMVAIKNESYSAAPLTDSNHGNITDRLVDSFMHSVQFGLKKGVSEPFRKEVNEGDRKEDKLSPSIKENLKKINLERGANALPELRKSYEAMSATSKLGSDYSLETLKNHLLEMQAQRVPLSTEERAAVGAVLKEIDGIYSQYQAQAAGWEHAVMPRSNEVILPTLREMLSDEVPFM